MRISPAPPPALDKKRTILLLRSVVVISTSYLILFGNAGSQPSSVSYIIALIFSNIVLAFTPRDWFHAPRFSAGLLLVDTAVVLTGLYLTVGCFSQDFLIIYFFTIFLTAATSSVAQIALGAALISGLYGYWLWLTAAHMLGAAEWLRLPFFFIVAVFYAYVTEETKQERYRREQAEREGEHLRFLLSLSDAFSQQIVSQQVVRQIGDLVEAAFPRLRCRLRLEAAEQDSRAAMVFLMHSHNHTFGALQVEPNDGGRLTADEEQFCKVVAVVAANALYTAEQVGAAEDGARLKREFLSALSHELRSPLHVILGNAEILADELASTANGLARESVHRLRASACRLLELIEELLCYAELRAGKSVVQVERVDVQALFEELNAVMGEQLADRPIRFEWAVSKEVPELYLDRRKLRLIVNSLLGNAAKFTERGFIRLSATRVSPQQIEIAVQDSGIGIEARDLAPIFQEFRQIDGSLGRRFEGIGLGLALTAELTRALGGRVDVQSEPQRGSTFRVVLPIAAAADTGRGLPEIAPAPATRHLITA